MTLPFLPMGSIMAVCMGIAALAVALVGPADPQRPDGRGAPARAALLGLAALLLAAGLWQIAWYFPRHPTERWGLAALASGALLIVAGAWCGSSRVRATARAARWPVAAGLGAMALLYGVAIARL